MSMIVVQFSDWHRSMLKVYLEGQAIKKKIPQARVKIQT